MREDKIKAAYDARLVYVKNDPTEGNNARAWVDAENELTGNEFEEYMRRFREWQATNG